MKKIFIAAAILCLSGCAINSNSVAGISRVVNSEPLVFGSEAGSVAAFYISESKDGVASMPVTIFIGELPYKAVFDICKDESKTIGELRGQSCPSVVEISVSHPGRETSSADVKVDVHTLNGYSLQQVGNKTETLLDTTNVSFGNKINMEPGGKVLLTHSKGGTTVQAYLVFRKI